METGHSWSEESVLIHGGAQDCSRHNKGDIAQGHGKVDGHAQHRA